MKNLTIYPRLFALLALGFVLATIIGTVSHELGHIAVAKSLGYETKLHYASIHFNWEEKLDFLETYFHKNEAKIHAEGNSPEKTYFKTAFAKFWYNDSLVRWGGPLQTMITGTLGTIMLWLRRKKILTYGMKTADWFWVIISFFWSRQLANIIIIGINRFLFPKTLPGGDEARISQYLRLPILTLNVVTGFIAGVVLIWVVFIIIPKHQRFTFITGGLAGSALGWMVWMKWIGPAVLP